MKQCEKLKEAGFNPKIEEGMRIARGFADLGYEEFYLLPNNKLLSIYTGKQSGWSETEEKFFFVVPEVEDLMVFLQKKEIVVRNILLSNHNLWEVDYIKDEKNKCSKNEQLILALVNILI